MDPLHFSQTLNSPIEFSRPFQEDQRVTNVKFIALPDNQLSTQNSHSSFLFTRLKYIRFSLGKKLSFTLEEFLADPHIRVKALSKIQKIIAKKIQNLSREILNEIRNAGNNVNFKTAKKIATIEQWNFLLKLIKQFNKIRNVNSESFKDFQSIFSLIAKVSNVYYKLNKGDIKIDLKDFLKQCNNIHDCLELSYDAFSSIQETVGIIDNNMFMKMVYSFLGCGKEFTPITKELVSTVSLIHSFISPINFYLKGSKFLESGHKWINFDLKTLEEHPLEYKRLIKIRKKFVVSSLDMTRETLKCGAEILTLTGVIAATPYTLTAVVALLSITSISMKIFKAYNRNDQPAFKSSALLAKLAS